MKIIDDRPPLFDKILEAFPMAGNPGVIFAWGNDIYAPGLDKISQPLVAHESVHGARQIADAVAGRLSDNEESIYVWWERYIQDVNFRFNEELLAHQKEYQAAAYEAINRKQRQYYLKAIAEKLSSPLYGRMTTVKQAKKLLKEAGSV